jgi:hypothetical protein
MCARFQFLCNHKFEKKCFKKDLEEAFILSATCLAKVEALYVHSNFLKVQLAKTSAAYFTISFFYKVVTRLHKFLEEFVHCMLSTCL